MIKTILHNLRNIHKEKDKHDKVLIRIRLYRYGKELDWWPMNLIKGKVRRMKSGAGRYEIEGEFLE